MAASEIFVRDTATGGSVSYSHHSVCLSSANAPWRDLVRLERCHKALESVEVSLLWSGLGLARSGGALDYRFDGQPMRSARMVAGDLFVYPQGETVYVNMPQPVELTSVQLAPAVLAAVGEEAGCTPRVAAGASLRADDVATIASLLEDEVQSNCEGGRLYGEHLA